MPHVPWRGPEGQLTLVPAGDNDALRIPDSLVRNGLTLRFRRGGERFHPADRSHSQSLKKWLQEHDVLPWMRGRIPLLYAGDELVAIADLCVSAHCVTGAGEGAVWTTHFVDHPPVK
jgi:tRNA(Ile)-lysidine synthetase-like protein